MSLATVSNELITMQGAHSLTEILNPGIILYSRGNTEALQDCAASLGVQVELGFGDKTEMFRWDRV